MVKFRYVKSLARIPRERLGMPSITITEETSKSIRAVAARKGVNESILTEEILVNGLSGNETSNISPPHKPFHAMQFSGISPSGRSASEIDDEINRSRDE